MFASLRDTRRVLVALPLAGRPRAASRGRRSPGSERQGQAAARGTQGGQRASAPFLSTMERGHKNGGAGSGWQSPTKRGDSYVLQRVAGPSWIQRGPYPSLYPRSHRSRAIVLARPQPAILVEDYRTPKVSHSPQTIRQIGRPCIRVLPILLRMHSVLGLIYMSLIECVSFIEDRTFMSAPDGTDCAGETGHFCPLLPARSDREVQLVDVGLAEAAPLDGEQAIGLERFGDGGARCARRDRGPRRERAAPDSSSRSVRRRRAAWRRPSCRPSSASSI